MEGRAFFHEDLDDVFVEHFGRAQSVDVNDELLGILVVRRSDDRVPEIPEVLDEIPNELIGGLSRPLVGGLWSCRGLGQEPANDLREHPHVPSLPGDVAQFVEVIAEELLSFEIGLEDLCHSQE